MVRAGRANRRGEMASSPWSAKSPASSSDATPSNPSTKTYDWIIIDTPPTSDSSPSTPLVPAATVIAPVSAEDEGAAQGVVELRATLEKLNRLRSTTAELLVVLTKVNTNRARPRITAVAIEDAVTAHGFRIAGRIPNRAAVHNAAVTPRPLATSQRDGLVMSAYKGERWSWRAEGEPFDRSARLRVLVAGAAATGLVTVALGEERLSLAGRAQLGGGGAGGGGAAGRDRGGHRLGVQRELTHGFHETSYSEAIPGWRA